MFDGGQSTQHFMVGLGPVSISLMPVSPCPGAGVLVSQVLSRKLYLPALKAGDASPPKIVAVDLQPMAPIEGVVQLQGDITSEETAAQVRGRGKWGWGERTRSLPAVQHPYGRQWIGIVQRNTAIYDSGLNVASDVAFTVLILTSGP